MSRTILYGADVAATLQADKEATVPQAWKGVFQSEPLCRWQTQKHNAGYREANIDKTIYGYSVRYASGLDNFAILAGGRRGDIDGTYEAALRFAEQWQAADPEHRVVYGAIG